MVHLLLTKDEAYLLTTLLKEKAVKITDHIMSDDLPFPYSEEDLRNFKNTLDVIMDIAVRIATNKDSNKNLTSSEWEILASCLYLERARLIEKYAGMSMADHMAEKYSRLWEKINVIESKIHLEEQGDIVSEGVE